MSENNKNNLNDKQDDKINEFDKLVIDIRNNLTTRLADLMSSLLNLTQEKLFSLSNEASNNEDQRRYFELMNQIRTLKPEIAAAFNKKIKGYLVPAKDYEALHKKKEIEEDDELSLIGQDEMEGIVLVKGIGERAAAKYREQLSHLEARLEHLATKTLVVFKENALLPTNFCQAFDDAMADNFDSVNKKLLFSFFDIEFAGKLDALYDSINNRLIDAGILPQIKLHMQRQKPAQPRPKPPQANPDQANENAAQDNYADGGYGGGQAGNYGAGGGGYSGGQAGNYGAGGAQGATGNAAPGGGSGSNSTAGSSAGNAGGYNISGFAMTAAPGGGYRHSAQDGTWSPTTGGGHDEGRAGSTQGGQPGGGASGGQWDPQGQGQGQGHYGSQGKVHADSQNSGEGHTEYQHYTAGMPASQVGRVLGNYLGGAAITPSTADPSSTSHGEFFPESTPQHFGHQEIIQALSSLQSMPQFVQPDTTHFDGEAIKQAVLAEIAKKSGGAITKRINTIAEKTIDFIELIFDAIIDDDDISDTIKALLLRLQIPIIKASMTDQEFFIYDDHPARLFLDTVADVGIGITDHKDEMYIHLDKIVSNILGEYDLSTETFQVALDALNAVIEEQEKVSRAKEKEEQNQLLRKHARVTVLKALRMATSGRTLPETVHPLILKRWPTLMFNHYMSKGKENNEWVNLVITLRHIVESVQPVSSVEHLAKLIAEKDPLFEATEKYLNASSNSRKDVQNIMAAYKETVQIHIDDANFTEQEVRVAEQAFSQAKPVEEAPIEEPSTQEKTRLPSNVMPGMWFQIYMGEDKTVRRCKLSAIIIEDENLMFVNHKGELIAEKSFNEFNDEIANDSTKMIMGHSAFDHAFKAVIDRLN